MGLSLFEQETTINIMRDSDVARIYTSDLTVMTKLDKLVKSEDCPEWKLVKKHYSQNHELVGKTYETNKRLISFRSNVITRDVSNEQRAQMAERLREYQEKKRIRNAVREYVLSDRASVSEIEDFLGYQISADILEDLETHVDDAFTQIPDEAVEAYYKKIL